MWQFPIGTVVRFIPTEEQPRALWGHVKGFGPTAQGATGLRILWEDYCFTVVLPSEVEVAA